MNNDTLTILLASIANVLIAAISIIVTVIGKHRSTVENDATVAQVGKDKAEADNIVAESYKKLADSYREELARLDVRVQSLEIKLADFEYGVPILLRQIRDECTAPPRWVPKMSQL